MDRERPNLMPFLLGAGLGATLMCLLDPQSGRRRRARLQDKSRHYGRVALSGAGTAGRDVRNRVSGLGHRAASLFEHDEDGSDQVIADRVRAMLGRFGRSGSEIDVEVRDGVAHLSGAVAERDLPAILRRTRRVRGVRGVESDLVPGLEPAADELGRGRPGASWNPTTRAASAVAGTAALSWAAVRRSPIAWAAGATGVALLARGLSNRPIATLVSNRPRGNALRVRKTFTVNAPVERVFRLWSHPEHFPRFFTHLDRVEPTAEGRYHWVAIGPAGARVDWDAELTEIEPNRRLAWRSLEGSQVDVDGAVEMTPDQSGGTRVHVDMRYAPPAGMLGHSVAWLTGQDPRSAMDEDLLRMKSLLEDGRTTARGEEVRLEEVLPPAGSLPM